MTDRRGERTLPGEAARPSIGGSRVREARLLGFRWIEIPMGIAAALIAVAIRYPLPLQPTELPVITVVIAVSLMGTFVGLAAGIATAVVGGLLSWYLFFTPFSFAMGPEGFVPLFGFVIITAVILATIQLYRRQARHSIEVEIAAARQQAATADLFARELAHRLKNALAIVQSLAVQTLTDNPEQTDQFTARLRTLANAHDLLTEHAERPTADVAEVVRTALQPFRDRPERLALRCPACPIPSQTVVSLALVLHELATNAAKYGAWSVPAGVVTLEIEDAGDAIRLRWQEAGGPPVAEPGEHGFGSRLVNRVGTDVDCAFEPHGLRYAITLVKS